MLGNAAMSSSLLESLKLKPSIVSSCFLPFVKGVSIIFQFSSSRSSSLIGSCCSSFNLAFCYRLLFNEAAIIAAFDSLGSDSTVFKAILAMVGSFPLVVGRGP
jgi:hypothetical protein